MSQPCHFLDGICHFKAVRDDTFAHAQAPYGTMQPIPAISHLRHKWVRCSNSRQELGALQAPFSVFGTTLARLFAQSWYDAGAVPWANEEQTVGHAKNHAQAQRCSAITSVAPEQKRENQRPGTYTISPPAQQFETVSSWLESCSK